MTLPPIILPVFSIMVDYDSPFPKNSAVYVLGSPFEAVCKIGCTSLDVTTRANAQRHGGLWLDGWCRATDHYAAEKAVHDRLTGRRLAPRPELFFITIEEARALVSAVCGTPYETQ
jgi:hypothetical protein